MVFHMGQHSHFTIQTHLHRKFHNARDYINLHRHCARWSSINHPIQLLLFTLVPKPVCGNPKIWRPHFLQSEKLSKIKLIICLFISAFFLYTGLVEFHRFQNVSSNVERASLRLGAILHLQGCERLFSQRLEIWCANGGPVPLVRSA